MLLGFRLVWTLCYLVLCYLGLLLLGFNLVLGEVFDLKLVLDVVLLGPNELWHCVTWSQDSLGMKLLGSKLQTWFQDSLVV